MPQAIASRKDSPICEDVVRLKIHVRKPVNYAHARAVCFFFPRRPRKEPGDEARLTLAGSATNVGWS